MKIAIEGCAHGDLDNIYDTVKSLEDEEGIKIDLLICCGDFQSSRNEEDLRCMAVPPKYYNLCSFYKYYNGEKTAPILTLFVGGNHEASNYLQELPYGGWVAPKIYYLGYAGVVNIQGIRIGGISGIYKGRDYLKGHFEIAPYNESTKRSVYHIRNLEILRLKQLSQKMDIFLSHDWPNGIWKYGNVNDLLKFKPHFREDIESDELGSPPCKDLLNQLKPTYWFAAHLHCKFAALVEHSDMVHTKFLALDKCLPKRRFLQVIDIPVDDNTEEVKLKYDLEWLTILSLTNHLLNVNNGNVYMPGPGGNERWEFVPTEEEKMEIYKRLEENLIVPENFVQTVKGHDNDDEPKKNIQQGKAIVNPQTTTFCDLLNIDDPIQILLKNSQTNDSHTSKLNATLNTSSFIEDSEISTSHIEDVTLDESNFSFVKSPLKLPEPKFTATTDKEEDVERINEEINEEIHKDVTTLRDDDKPRKKFKRRNGDIYVNDAD